nr:immunoglobulin heavy chain junction region [Mus musculus]
CARGYKGYAMDYW